MSISKFYAGRCVFITGGFRQNIVFVMLLRDETAARERSTAYLYRARVRCALDNVSGIAGDTLLVGYGGLGFIGKQIIEKLFRSCPDIDRIYMLMRAKKELSPQQRLQKMLSSAVCQSVVLP